MSINVVSYDEVVIDDDGFLAALGEEIAAVNEANGWYETNPAVKEFVTALEHSGYSMSEGAVRHAEALAERFFGERTFGDDVALLATEVSEMMEAFRDNGMADVAGGKAIMINGKVVNKPEGVGSEAADVLIRLLDLCKRRDIDLWAETRRKLTYNAGRGYRHGGKAL